jgi:hypothetical protein
MAGSTSMSGGGATAPRHYLEGSEVTGWVAGSSWSYTDHANVHIDQAIVRLD